MLVISPPPSLRSSCYCGLRNFLNSMLCTTSSFFPAFDGFFGLKDSNEFTLINLLKWRSSSVTLVKPLLDVDDPPCCLWSQQLNLYRRDVRYGYFEFAKVLSKKPKMSIFENKLFFMDNPAVEIWASLAKFKLKSLNLLFPLD